VLKPELITRANASIIKGSEARIRMKATDMEMGKPSERMLICGAALEIKPVARDVRNNVPRIGREITIASINRRERPEASMATTGSLPSTRETMLIVCTQAGKA